MMSAWYECGKAETRAFDYLRLRSFDLLETPNSLDEASAAECKFQVDLVRIALLAAEAWIQEVLRCQVTTISAEKELYGDKKKALRSVRNESVRVVL